MPTTRRGRVFRATLSGTVARRLLDGRDGPPPLSQLLAAATAPATAAELHGETAARAAFRSSPHTSPLPLDNPRRAPVKTTTTIMVAKAIAAIALTASTAGGVALATNSSSTPPRSPVGTAGEAATREIRPADISVPTTARSTPTPDDPARPDAPVGLARDDEAGSNGIADRTRPSAAAPHATGQCRAFSNISADGHPGKAVDSPAFADLTCSDSVTDTNKTTGRPPAPPGNPDQNTGKPGTERPESRGSDNRSGKGDQADGHARRDPASGHPDEKASTKNQPNKQAPIADRGGRG